MTEAEAQVVNVCMHLSPYSFFLHTPPSLHFNSGYLNANTLAVSISINFSVFKAPQCTTYNTFSHPFITHSTQREKLLAA